MLNNVLSNILVQKNIIFNGFYGGRILALLKYTKWYIHI